MRKEDRYCVPCQNEEFLNTGASASELNQSKMTIDGKPTFLAGLTGAPPLYNLCKGRGVNVEIEAFRLLAAGTPSNGVNSLAGPATLPAKPEWLTGAAIEMRLAQLDRFDMCCFNEAPAE